eukprot:9898027-Alexandrium_andersonii.AAC.1
MEGVTGPLPPSRPMPPAGQASCSAGQVPADPAGQLVVPPRPPSNSYPAVFTPAADPPPPLPEQLSVL